MGSLCTSVWPWTSIVIEFGVRYLKTKPKFRAAETSAASSGLCAWYSSLRNITGMSYLWVQLKRILIDAYLPSLYSGITVWHNASNLKNVCTCSSSAWTASIREESNHLKCGSYSGLNEKSIGCKFYFNKQNVVKKVKKLKYLQKEQRSSERCCVKLQVKATVKSNSMKMHTLSIEVL